MKFLTTLNMPSASGMLVHQIIIESKAKSLKEFCAIISADEFVVFRQWYKKRSLTGEVEWEDRGDIVVNTSHIGKAQEYIDYDSEEGESRRNSGSVQPSFERTREPIRPRSRVF